MGFLISNLMIKILLGIAIVGSVVWAYEKPQGDSPCVTISNYPNHSEVFQCPAGLSTVNLQNTTGRDIFTTITTDVRTEGWLTTIGDGETVKTIRKNLGPSVVMAPGAFMAVANGKGLVYVESDVKYLLTVVWDVRGVPNN